MDTMYIHHFRVKNNNKKNKINPIFVFKYSRISEITNSWLTNNRLFTFLLHPNLFELILFNWNMIHFFPFFWILRSFSFSSVVYFYIYVHTIFYECELQILNYGLSSSQNEYEFKDTREKVWVSLLSSPNENVKDFNKL